MKKRSVSVLLAGIILLGAIGIATTAVALFSRGDDVHDVAVEAAPKVEVMPIAPERVENSLDLTGTAHPWEDIVLSAETAGPVEWIGPEEGETVEAGAELVRVDTASLQAQLDEAQAQLTLARQEFDRAQRLAQRGVAAERDLDSARASLDVAEANVRVLRIQLDKSVVEAPIAGVVDTLLVDENEFVDMGSPLVRLVQVDRLKVEVGVPERDVVYFEVGDPVQVRFDALRGESLTGHIHRIATTADPVTHTFSTEVALDNPNGRVRPGMVTRLAFVRETYEDAVVVPVFSTFLLEDQRFAFVVEDGVARLRAIETGQVLGGRVVVTGGIGPGDRLIVRGQYDVRDGDQVDVVNALETGGAAGSVELPVEAS